MTALLLLVLCVPPTFAKPPKTVELSESASRAEASRLEQEVRRKIERSQWQAAKSQFDQLVALGNALTATQLLLGAQIASNQGDSFTVMKYAQKGFSVVLSKMPYEQAEEDNTGRKLIEMNSSISAGYGLVAIRVPPSRRTSLFVDRPPFTLQAKTSISFAQERLKTHRYFQGMLPVGAYALDGHPFMVRANLPIMEVIVPEK